MKKVIITGGAGFIGTSLVKALLDNDIEKILIIDDLSTGSKSNLDNLLSNKKIEFIESRIEDAAEWGAWPAAPSRAAIEEYTSKLRIAS